MAQTDSQTMQVTLWNALLTYVLLGVMIAQPRAQPKDFSFRFVVGSCLREEFNSSSGVFTKNLGAGQTATVTMSLTAAQMTTIDQTVQEIRFFEYPSKFSGVAVKLGLRRQTDPSITYRLDVLSAGKVHAVKMERWNFTPDARR